MAVAARSWEHERWHYDPEFSPAARRSAARAAARSREDFEPRYEPAPAPATDPALRVVRRPRARVGAILLVAAFLGIALAAPVGINLAVVRTEWRIAELRQQQDDAVAERSTLRAEHAALSSTQRVKDTADRLGMVPPTEVGFLDLGGARTADPSAAGPEGPAARAGGEGTVVADAPAGVDAGR